MKADGWWVRRIMSLSERESGIRDVSPLTSANNIHKQEERVKISDPNDFPLKTLTKLTIKIS